MNDMEKRVSFDPYFDQGLDRATVMETAAQRCVLAWAIATAVDTPVHRNDARTLQALGCRAVTVIDRSDSLPLTLQCIRSGTILLRACLPESPMIHWRPALPRPPPEQDRTVRTLPAQNYQA